MNGSSANSAAPRYDGHPLVATRALLEGRARPFPSAAGARQPTGTPSTRALDRLALIAEALFSKDGSPPPRERIAWLRAELGDFLSRASLLGRAMFVVGSLVVCWLAPVFVGALPPLSRLPLSRRIEALECFEGRRVAPVLIALRAILCLLYYEHPDAAAEVGIGAAGPPGGKLFGAIDAESGKGS